MIIMKSLYEAQNEAREVVRGFAIRSALFSFAPLPIHLAVMATSKVEGRDVLLITEADMIIRVGHCFHVYDDDELVRACSSISFKVIDAAFSLEDHVLKKLPFPLSIFSAIPKMGRMNTIGEIAIKYYTEKSDLK
jgi:hypothetical protein